MAGVLGELERPLEALLLEDLVAATAKVTVSRTLIVERDYEPSRISREAMASSYETLIPIKKASRHCRRVAVGNEPVRYLGETRAAGGSW